MTALVGRPARAQPTARWQLVVGIDDRRSVESAVRNIAGNGLRLSDAFAMTRGLLLGDEVRYRATVALSRVNQIMGERAHLSGGARWTSVSPFNPIGQRYGADTDDRHGNPDPTR